MEGTSVGSGEWSEPGMTAQEMQDKLGFIIVSEYKGDAQQIFPGHAFSCTWDDADLVLPPNTTVFVQREISFSEAYRISKEIGLSGYGVTPDYRYYAAVAE